VTNRSCRSALFRLFPERPAAFRSRNARSVQGYGDFSRPPTTHHPSQERVREFHLRWNSAGPFVAIGQRFVPLARFRKTNPHIPAVAGTLRCSRMTRSPAVSPSTFSQDREDARAEPRRLVASLSGTGGREATAWTAKPLDGALRGSTKTPPTARQARVTSKSRRQRSAGAPPPSSSSGEGQFSSRRAHERGGPRSPEDRREHRVARQELGSRAPRHRQSRRIATRRKPDP